MKHYITFLFLGEQMIFIKPTLTHVADAGLAKYWNTIFQCQFKLSHETDFDDIISLLK